MRKLKISGQMDWMDYLGITIAVCIAVIALLTGCYVDRVVEHTKIQWHRAPVSCLTLAPPEHPKERYGACWTLTDGQTTEECERLENAKWAEYGRDVSLWIEGYVIPTCYEAVGRAGGPQ